MLDWRVRGSPDREGPDDARKPGRGPAVRIGANLSSHRLPLEDAPHVTPCRFRHPPDRSGALPHGDACSYAGFCAGARGHGRIRGAARAAPGRHPRWDRGGPRRRGARLPGALPPVARFLLPDGPGGAGPHPGAQRRDQARPGLRAQAPKFGPPDPTPELRDISQPVERYGLPVQPMESFFTILSFAAWSHAVGKVYVQLSPPDDRLASPRPRST